VFNLKKILSFPRFTSKKKDGVFYTKIKALLGFSPKNLSFYSEAFTHPSYQYQKATRKSYERLEFLGDAILGAVIADYIFTNAPEEDEGYLTKMRSKIVERRNLNELGKEMKLLDFLRTKLTPRQLGNNITGNLFEALIGAIYLDKGYKTCFSFIERKLILPNIDITWEETKTLDLGLDFALLNNRLSGAIDYYSKYTSGILYSPSIGLIYGDKRSPLQNLAD